MLLTYLISLLVIYLPLPVSPGQGPGWWVPLAVSGIMLLNGVACWVGSRWATRMRASRAGHLRSVRVFKMLKMGIVGFVFVDVMAFNWPGYVLEIFSSASIPVLPDLLLIAPLLIMIGTYMAFRYRHECASHEDTRAARLSVWGYILLRFRMELAILIIPWFLIVLVSDITALMWLESPYYAWIDGGVSVVLMVGLVTLGPAALKYVWSTSRLPEGPLRTRLEGISEEHGFRCREILVWHTQKHIPNAAVIGPLPFMRYVLVTDALLDNCTNEEIAGIFAHEVAHIVQHHMRFYLVFAIMYALIVTNAAEVLEQLGIVRSLTGFLSESTGQTTALMMLGFTFLYWVFGFGYVSRRMEQQADLFALRDLADPETFVRALNKLSMLSGRPTQAGSWRHFSIARRTDFLRRVMENPEIGEDVEKKAYWLRIAVAGVFVANLLALVVM